jgi:DnaJ-class molecular chaperone
MARDGDDYYDTLGVQKDASPDEIKRSFKSKAKHCHPDLHPGDEAAQEKFVRLNEAFDVLGDATHRQAYDACCAEKHDAPRRDAPRGTAVPCRPPAARVESPGRVVHAVPPWDHPRACTIARGGPVPGFGTVLEAACPSCRGRGCLDGRPCVACGGRGWLRVAGRGARSW